MTALYDRFLDIHIANPDGWYDFSGCIKQQQDYQTDEHESHLPTGLNLVAVDRTGDGAICRPLVGVHTVPSRGHVAMVAGLDAVRDHTRITWFTSLVEWVNDAGHLGKLRVNCHGDGQGHIGMPSQNGHEMFIDAGHLVSWLVANGMTHVKGRTKLRRGNQPRGLATMSLALCMAGMSGVKSAKLNFRQTSSHAAPGSVIALVLGGLRREGLRGIEVTGSNEIVKVLNGKLGRSNWNDLPFPYEAGPGGRGSRFLVPKGWKVTSYKLQRGGELHIPTRYKLVGTSPNAGWELRGPGRDVVYIPTGWIVDAKKRIVVPPHGWHVKSNGGTNGGVVAHDTLKYGHAWERLAGSKYKIREVS